MSGAPRLELLDWGRLDYESAWARQLERVELRKQGAVGDALIVVEHPHVITLGRRRDARANVVAPGDVPVVEIERGGDVTYHGPGQLVAYPILLLAEGERDLHAYLRHLEDAIIGALGRFGLEAGREPGKTGVWRDGRKLASIGIACRRWVTFHGLALNVSTDLTQFARINPCGFDAAVMTSIERELGAAVDMAAVKRALAEELAAATGRALSPT